MHGAMCISYSGRGLISNYINRQRCEPRRLCAVVPLEIRADGRKRPGQYFPVDEDERGTYLYNSKDMCMIDHIPELIEAGVTSFKIEGRAKTAYYTAGITASYRRAIDAYFENPTPVSKVPEDIREEIGKISHREYFTGFYFGRDPKGQYYPDVMYIRDWESPVCLTAAMRMAMRFLF